MAEFEKVTRQRAEEGKAARKAGQEFDLEARWRGDLGPQERQDVKSWSKMASSLGRCELKLGRERSRMTVKFDRQKLQERSRADMERVEGMLRREGQSGTAGHDLAEAAKALESLRNASIESTQGLLVKDYGEVLARDWAVQSSAALHALLPARCGLKVSLGRFEQEAAAGTKQSGEA